MSSSTNRRVPLGSVKTYREGFLRLQGWMAFSALAFFTAGLAAMSELLILNVEDQDFRDLLFDYRITRGGVSYQHKQFANGHLCCNADPAVFGPTNCSVSTAMRAEFAAQAPGCPPSISFTCPDLASAACNQLRSLLYPAVGLNSSTGQPLDCSRAGRATLRAVQDTAAAAAAGGGGGIGYMLSAAGADGLPGDLVLDPSSFDAAVIQGFVQQVLAAADPMFVVPRTHLAKSVNVGGQAVPLVVKWQAEGRDKWGEFGWPWELWPWPPSAGCSNTSQPATMWLEGVTSAPFSPIQTNVSKQPPTFTFTVMAQPLLIPQYRVLPASAAAAMQTGWMGVGPFARYHPDRALDPSSGERLRSLAADQQQQVTVLALTGVQLSLGLVAPLGGCEAWQLHRPGVLVQYGRAVWEGSLGALGKLSSQQAAAPAVPKVVDVSLHDVSEPQPLALPHYNGEVYIYVALVLGGVWLLSTAPLVITIGVMVLNVQRNRGLPIFFYKYMRQYRGW